MAEKERVADAEVIAERRHLMALAFRMLGTIAEAEDVVQETYTRWYRMSEAERAVISSPRGWLTRAASRICLDMLGSARMRRERYVGPWLPEPVPTPALSGPGPDPGADPVDRVTFEESISTALLVVLESMTPAERVVFVLHDVFAIPFGEIAATIGRSPAACRQLATSARRRVEQSRARRVSRREHDEVVRAFAAAARSGDLSALIGTLDTGVVVRADGGGLVTAARNPIFGAARVARYLLGALYANPRTEVREQQTNDGLGFALREDGRITGVVTLDVIDGRVAHIRMTLNPEKLSLWNAPAGHEVGAASHRAGPRRPDL